LIEFKIVSTAEGHLFVADCAGGREVRLRRRWAGSLVGGVVVDRSKG